MDPRIRQRRIQVKRDEGRRRLRFLIWLVGGLTVVGAAVVATRSPLLDVDRLEVRGADHTTTAALHRALAVAPGDLMIEIDGVGAARRLERLPWVARASVERRWPGTVTVRVVERRAVAAVPAAGDRWASVDAAGQVLEVGAAPPTGLVRVVGARPVAAVGERLPAPLRSALAVAGAVPPALRERVPEVLTAPDGLQLRLAPAGTVRFGPAEAVAPKLRALATLLERVDLAGVAVIDLRVPDAPVVTRA